MSKPWYAFYPEGVPKTIEVPAMNLFNILEQSEKKYAENYAIIDGEQKITYHQLKKLSENFARNLYNLGIKKGTHIAIMLPNSKDYIVVYYAIQRLGGIAVPLNPMYQSQELDYILRDSEATWFISLKEQKEKLKKIDMLDSLNVIFLDEKDGNDLFYQQKYGNEELPDLEINPKQDIAMLMFTGGTTGKPKGVMLTHYNIVANLYQSYIFNKKSLAQRGHIQLGVAPLSHAMGMSSLQQCILIGATYITVKRFNPELILELFRKYRPTMFMGSPTMYIGLLNSPSLRKDDLKSLKICNSGSAPMPIEVMKKFEEKSGAKIIESYGLTEASPATHRNPIMGKRKVGSIGIPMPNTDALIVDLETGKKELKPGEIGELIIKGPQVMSGYWKNEEETIKTIREGWLYTGDIAKMDEDGYFYIVGRKKEMIISGGYNIYPVEIEEVIYRHPEVEEVCVIGIPDEYRGEIVKAFVVVKNKISEEEIVNWCKERLAAYKVPRLVEFRESLPKTAVGKILRRQLKLEGKK